MPLISFVIYVVVIGVILWVVNKYIPMQDQVKKFLNIAVVVLLCVWLLIMLFGINLGSLNTVRIGPVH
jgi:hypothetical protein